MLAKALDLAALVLLLFVSLSSVQSSQEVWQWATLYTGKDGSGEPLAIMEDESDNLEELGFGTTEAECHIGAWVVLGAKIFAPCKNVKGLGASGCNNRALNGKAIRFAGDPSNYTRDALTLFEQVCYGKAKQVFYTDGNVKISLVNSMAATGSSDWTIYKDSNYAGDSVCLKFTYKDYQKFILQLDGTEVKPFNIAEDWISSVRKGCHSSSVLMVK